MGRTQMQTWTGTKAWTLIAIAWALVYFSCPSLLRSATPSPQMAQPYWNHFLNDAVSDAGLDVRDASNRPVSSKKARSDFRELFRFSFFSMLANADLPVLARIRKALEEALNPLAQAFRRVGAVLGAAQTAFLSAVRWELRWAKGALLLVLEARPPSPSSLSPDSIRKSPHPLLENNLPLRC